MDSTLELAIDLFQRGDPGQARGALPRSQPALGDWTGLRGEVGDALRETAR